MQYIPNPARKLEMAAAVLPSWLPDNEPSLLKMLVATKEAIPQILFPENCDNPQSRRFAVRRGSSSLEFFSAKAKLKIERGAIKYLGCPVNRDLGEALAQFIKRDCFTNTERIRYRKLLG